METLLAEHDLDEFPKDHRDVLAPAHRTATLIECGINPVKGGAEKSLVAAIVAQLKVNPTHEQTVQRICCVCLAVHCLFRAHSMSSYEQFITFLQMLGMLQPNLRICGDDAGWRIARIADAVVLNHLQKRLETSKYLAFSIDDSADICKQEQCCIVVYLLHQGRREAHLLKFHALPRAATRGRDISREVAHVLTKNSDHSDLEGECYGIGGLSREQLARKTVSLASDGARNMMSTEVGALKLLQESLAPHAQCTWCLTHRVALIGADLETDAIVQAVRRFVISVSGDMSKSAQRTQQRLLVIKEVLEKEIAVLHLHQVRWASMRMCLRNLLKQLGPLTVYYFERALEGDAVANGLSDTLTDIQFVLHMHGLLGILDTLHVLTQTLQKQQSGFPDVFPAIEKCRRSLQQLYLANATGTHANDPGCSCGKAFGDLVCNERVGMDSNFTIQMLDATDARIQSQVQGESSLKDGDKVCCMAVNSSEPSYLVLWHSTGKRTFVPTKATQWDACVADARTKLWATAKAGIDSVDARVPLGAQTMLTNCQWLNATFWGLEANQDPAERAEAVLESRLSSVAKKIQDFAEPFCDEEELLPSDLSDDAVTVPAKLPADIFMRDLDGLDGDGARQLQSTLADEVQVLPSFVKLWPDDPSTSNGLQSWDAFWGDLVSDSASNFVELCPNIAEVVQMILVMPHGSVENERQFSNMNYIKDEGRSRLGQIHLNAAARVRSERNMILVPFAPAWAQVCKEVLNLDAGQPAEQATDSPDVL